MSAAAPACTPRTEPEALEVTNTYFDDQTKPQASQLATGAGVKVAILADGADPQNADLIRGGQSIVTDYKDFTGDGILGVTDGREAFGDLSAIGAQGNGIYDVSKYVNGAHSPAPGCPLIKIRGMAPGVTIQLLQVFGSSGSASSSEIATAVEYAVDHGSDIINESLGGQAYPDVSTDPLSLANSAAVAAGLTVVESSGDAGITNTLGPSATSPDVINAGGTTTFRLYPQTGDGGYPTRQGAYISNNISMISSAGFSFGDYTTPGGTGPRTIDVVAPADLGWALCSTNTAIYQGCTGLNNLPSGIQDFGGTSYSAPLTSGAAALVIQAYRDTHGGASPAPALVKQILMNTATDLNAPADEQGAGLINSLKAVQLARSYQDGNGTPAPLGTTTTAFPASLTAVDLPGTSKTFQVTVTNSGVGAQAIFPAVQKLDAPFYTPPTYIATIVRATGPTFTDAVGRKRVYTTQAFTVPYGVQRLTASIAWDVVAKPGTLVRVTLIDPSGAFTAFSIPQGAGQGFGVAEVRNPRPVPGPRSSGPPPAAPATKARSSWTSQGRASSRAPPSAPSAPASCCSARARARC